MANKRLLREIRNLTQQQNQKDFLENDYLVQLDEDNINRVNAILKGPTDSVYRHKFIRLDLTIPENYPYSPPVVTFVNHDNIRIHPNMYENGKCCATILNTWGDSEYEKWTSSMGIETVLLAMLSFLDNNPYMYEPGGRDDPEYTVFVTYFSWQTCLTRYLQYEKIPIFCQFIQNYMLSKIDSIFNDLTSYASMYPSGWYHTRCFEIGNYAINYPRLIEIIQNYYNYIDYTQISDRPVDYNDFNAGDYQCSICYDTANDTSTITLHCGHTFHNNCLKTHIQNNHELCPMCRSPLDTHDNLLLNVKPDWIINPLTKRKIKVNGKTYKYLLDNGHISE
ncbi:hypothetical protein EB118_11635 [bacterium]|nr:hypothetical protein [bacterium]NDD83682.1 hypothetical protein [bacterium]NDG30710.1 hypothetical protein [bacterium]